MRISDLYEGDSGKEFDEGLKKDVLDIIMMFSVNDIDQTHVNNIIEELVKRNYSPSKEDIVNIINNTDYTIDDDDIVTIIDIDENMVDPEDIKDDPSVETEDEFDPAKQRARQAVKDRLK